MELPPGVYGRSQFYIRVVRPGGRYHDEEVWAAKYSDGTRGWNISRYYAHAFVRLAEAKAVMRQIARRQDLEGAQITIVEVTLTHTIRTAHPEEVLDTLARVL